MLSSNMALAILLTVGVAPHSMECAADGVEVDGDGSCALQVRSGVERASETSGTEQAGVSHGRSTPTIRSGRTTTNNVTARQHVYQKLQGTSATAPEVQAIYDLLNDANSYGVMIHNMAVDSVHEVVDYAWDNDMTIPWVYEGQTGPLNDCYMPAGGDAGDPSLTNGRPYCSAWALIHRSILPMVYNYPPMAGMPNGQHQVGILLGAAELAESRDTTMFVVDGDSWHRNLGGIHMYDSDLIGDFVTPAGEDASSASYDCWNSDVTACGEDSETCKWPYCWTDSSGGFYCGAHVGAGGERWTDMFMNNGLTQQDAQIRQCHFRNLADADQRSAYMGSLNNFYDTVLDLDSSGHLNLPDGGMYLENEVDVDIGDGGESLGWFEDLIKAVVVQDNRCWQQIPNDARCDPGSADSWYPNGDEEDQVLNSFLAGCRLSDLLGRKLGKHVPVIAGRFLSNAVVVPDEWNGFRAGGDAFANEQWLPDFTWYCCDPAITQGTPFHYIC